MPVLTAIAALFIMQFLGEVVVRLTGLPVPGPLAGMLLMLVALIFHGRVPVGLRDTCHHLLKHLMLLFIPLVAGIMLHFGPLADEWIPFLLACIGGVALTIVATALSFRWMLRRSRAPGS
ncbi:CidA/LrgA family protein [Pollutimonas nitritireducens]|uniref:CidA/LrgA family protein n=1 Tax=Pollutimonas nitritireducens TaxID=2045209 RepID=A0A2N4UGE6_9BURK|nr:CidA/LrgA family protein [Pollutimonas nitritireducens]PLC54086.1 CidA/LrgA family protein [Pollutimonas nitritireducens]